MTTGKSNLIEVAVTIEHETDKAILANVGNKEPVWLPKSQIEINGDRTITVPEWLAAKKGII